MSLPSNVPLPNSGGSGLTVLSNTMATPANHPYALHNSPHIRTNIVPNGSIAISTAPASALTFSPRMQAPSRKETFSTPESTKAARIKEYLGIAANISDWDFEALQQDIQALGASLCTGVDDSDPIPGRPLLGYTSSAPTVHVAVPSSLRLPSSLLTPSSPGEPLVRSPLPSDTESSDEEARPRSRDLEEEVDARLLRQLESQCYAVSWRWSWLQLQSQEVQHTLARCALQIATARQAKGEPLGNEGAGSLRCGGWNLREAQRPLAPPPAQVIHFRLGKVFHPLFNESPRPVTVPRPPPSVPSPASPTGPRTRSTVSPRVSARVFSRRERDRLRRERNKLARLQENQSTSSDFGLGRRRGRRTAEYDINNVVLPQSGVVQKIRTIEYKEIITPTFRSVPGHRAAPITSDGMSSSGEEDTDDEIYEKRHAIKEVDEKTRF